jgi:hypothetical protein
MKELEKIRYNHLKLSSRKDGNRLQLNPIDKTNPSIRSDDRIVGSE